MVVRRILAAWPVSLVLFAAAAPAQVSVSQYFGPRDPAPPVERESGNVPRFRPVQDPTQPGQPLRDGLIAAYPLRENFTIGVGRFIVPRIARPRTNMETDGISGAVRRRNSGIAAVGFSLRF